jgi:hypothetical protein
MGGEHFERAPAELLSGLTLRREDVELLRDIGLPTGPEKALALFLRFENVKVIHQPGSVRRLIDAGVENGEHFPKTGHPEIDAWADLSQFVALGEVPNDFGPGAFFLTRFVCVDGVRGNVWWVYPKLLEGKTSCCLFNASLPTYLACLLAYKEFREEWFEDQGYISRAERIHKTFLERLERADPVGFKEGFWECHAWNEAILMGVG